MSFNLATLLRESRKAHPEKPLCHSADQTFSYAQVDEISGRIATSLRNLGVHRGDKVAIQLPNVPHFLFAYFGILKAGAVVVLPALSWAKAVDESRARAAVAIISLRMRKPPCGILAVPA